MPMARNMRLAQAVSRLAVETANAAKKRTMQTAPDYLETWIRESGRVFVDPCFAAIANDMTALKLCNRRISAASHAIAALPPSCDPGATWNEARKLAKDALAEGKSESGTMGTGEGDRLRPAPELGTHAAAR